MSRTKWFKASKNIECGDIVVVADPTIANSWRLGVVIDAKPGSLSQNRKLTIRLGRHKIIPHYSTTNLKRWKQHYLLNYQAEESSIISRAAHDVAAINLRVDLQ
jgi:Family of unknown function (DUF5641)